MRFSKDYQSIGTDVPHWTMARKAFVDGISGWQLNGVRLVSDLGDHELYTDDMVEKVFHNLLQNWLVHGQKVPAINVRAEENGSGLMIVIEDDAVGIPSREKGPSSSGVIVSGWGTSCISFGRCSRSPA